ncbi:MAG: hypothetical protein ACE5G7_01020 [Candidatus Hydrothermarchaeaceae archaeon]
MLEIRPLASDSSGTRSMATYVETSDIAIVIDPAVALGPRRYRLPPHPLEFQRMETHWGLIKNAAKGAEILVVTHYHYDHHDPGEPQLYRDKRVFLKHPRDKINKSQKERAAYFLERIEGYPREVEYSDEGEYEFGGSKIRFSQAVSHGPGTRLGYVIQVSIRDGDECFVFTSDIEGPCVSEQVEFIIEEDPTVVYIDGPLSYMLGYRYSHKSLEKSLENMIRILRETRAERLIVDHHLLRDLRWRDIIKPVFDEASERGKEVLTSAEFSGVENDMLEARRKELYSNSYKI